MFVSCSGKRQALGADNEIRVICSEIDQEIIEKYLSKIFTDTIFTPEPEPYYHLKFSSPETFLSLKSQSQVIVAAIHQDKSNPGYQLMSRLLSSKQITGEFTSTYIYHPDVPKRIFNLLPQIITWSKSPDLIAL
mgnify:CR=1 FL=1